MTGPSPPLYGSSSMNTGGATHGHAVGNVFNLADAGEDDEKNSSYKKCQDLVNL